MSDESSGTGQGALPPREGLTSRSVVERPAVRLTQVAGGQYLLTSQTHAMPALAQVSLMFDLCHKYLIIWSGPSLENKCLVNFSLIHPKCNNIYQEKSCMYKNTTLYFVV